MRCSTLLLAATRYSTLADTEEYMSQVLIPLSSFVTRCNTLQHAATRCNTLADTEEYVGQVLIPLSSFVSTNETSKVHIQTSVCSYTRFFRGLPVDGHTGLLRVRLICGLAL